VKLTRITNSQSDQGGGFGISIDTSCLNHGGGSGVSFRDKLIAIDDSSRKIYAAC